MMTPRRVASLVLFTLFLAAQRPAAPPPGDSLLQNFRNPPDGAKPRVWWHWMNGNITKQGIKADFEWMKRVGIGGFQNFDASLNTPQVVEKRLIYMTPEWKDAFRYATTLADQMGLEMAIAGSPGWSESGGPWVPPSQGMKKLVWSETRVEGGRAFSGSLPKPPIVSGPFQNIPGGGRNFGGNAGLVAPPRFLRRRGRDRVSRAGRRRSHHRVASENYVKRRRLRFVRAHRRRSHEGAGVERAGKRRRVDPVRVCRAAHGARPDDCVASACGSGTIARIKRRGPPVYEGLRPSGAHKRATAHHFLCPGDGKILPCALRASTRAGNATALSGHRTRAALGRARESLRRESRLRPRTDALFDGDSVESERRDPQDRRRGSHHKDAPRRLARLDAAARPMGGAAHGLFVARHHEPSRVTGSHGTGSGQVESRLCEGVSRQISRSIQGCHGRLDGPARTPLRDHR